MDEKEVVTFTTGFELQGPPKRSGLIEAKLDPDTGEPLSLTYLSGDPLSTQERAEVLFNIENLLSQIGGDLVRDLKRTKPQDTVDIVDAEVVSH